MARAEPLYIPREDCSRSRRRDSRSASPPHREHGRRTPSRSRSRVRRNRDRTLQDNSEEPPVSTRPTSIEPLTLLEQQYLTMVEDLKTAQAHRWRVDSEEQCNVFVKVAKWILARIPYLGPMLPLLEERPLDLILLSNFASIFLLLLTVRHADYPQIDHHGRAGRTADLSTLKDHIHNWIPDVALEIAGEDELIILSPRVDGVFNKNRGDWGWNSLWSARLLVKRSARDEFDQDPEGYQEGLRHAKNKSNHTTLPSFLYAEYSGVPGDPSRPDSATKDPGIGGAGRPSISRVHGVDNVTPENVGYITCLLRHILSSEITWKDHNVRVFNGVKFFDKVVDLLNSNGLGKSVLAHFISHVYGTTIVDEADDDLDDEFESLKRALAARDAEPDPSGDEPVA
ncbi:hypothetical protein BN946_scf184665.g24 [Trametes cinnabarina]|uniref:Uncharacterized protein n=1 Tax=Pycnoporus cinnabarinus TaxID=5643 RepID=A0A060SNB7_PYCCI|nr:hypothetical protein BN946_scf184665.g24 [Trametes cinnabarina]